MKTAYNKAKKKNKRRWKISADWKQPYELIEQIINIQEELGLKIREDPDYKDSDTYGYIIEKVKQK